MSSDSEFSFATVIGFRQIDANRGLQRFSSRCTCTSAATTAAATTTSAKPKAFEQVSERAEDVIDIMKTAAAAAACAFNASMAMAIIPSTLVGIVQNFERLRGFFELTNSLFIIRIAVRMILEGQFLVGLLQFFR